LTGIASSPIDSDPPVKPFGGTCAHNSTQRNAYLFSTAAVTDHHAKFNQQQHSNSADDATIHHHNNSNRHQSPININVTVSNGNGNSNDMHKGETQQYYSYHQLNIVDRNMNPYLKPPHPTHNPHGTLPPGVDVDI